MGYLTRSPEDSIGIEIKEVKKTGSDKKLMANLIQNAENLTNQRRGEPKKNCWQRG